MIASSSSTNYYATLALVAVASASSGIVAHKLWLKRKRNPETDHKQAHDIVWKCIGGSLQAAMLYAGDKLDLYSTLRSMCQEPRSSVTAIELAKETGYNQRWLREWLAQQASMGILQLLPGTGSDDASLQYRLPAAFADVLANPESKEYDIAMIGCVPSLVNRAKTMLPEAFRTGIGRPYDEPEVSDGIDRQHQIHIRDVLIPKVIPMVDDGAILSQLQQGCKVADLGCGAGNLALALARSFPASQVHGYEISNEALTIAAQNLARSKLSNAYFHNESEEPMDQMQGGFDIVTTFDVLHDAANPAELIQQVRKALKPNGVWLLADIPAAPSLRESIETKPSSAVYLGFSVCLCMSCSLSTKDGAGLGTLGFTVPVAEQMLKAGGFSSVSVVFENDSVRWFRVS